MTMTKLIVAIAAGVVIAGCSVDKATPPPLMGPSELGLSVTLTASPDQLPRDGSSQSVVTVTVRDASGRPVSGQRLFLSTDMGTLSQSEATTASGGQTSFVFTAPPSGTVGNSAKISVTPMGTDAGNAVPRVLSIGLTGTSNTTLPFPQFAVTPATPEVNTSARFDASATTDEGAACLDACTYAWDFGDGTSATGRIVTHTFTAARSYTVTLTVTDAAGSTASNARTVDVSAVAAPAVTLTVSPNPPLSGQTAVFTATATPAARHSIVRYEWDFGDGTTQTTTVPTVTHTYANLGTYVARVTATDDVGQTGSAALTFNIVGTGVFASFTVSPSNPAPNTTVSFNASASVGGGGAAIVKWSWDFGNGTTVDESDAIAETSYSSVGTYTVTLTVTDSGGRTGRATATVSVTVNQP
jgi:PKD repeat protein